MTIQFKTGLTYISHSSVDHETIGRFKVIKRTRCFVHLEQWMGERCVDTFKKKVSVSNGVEVVSPNSIFYLTASEPEPQEPLWEEEPAPTHNPLPNGHPESHNEAKPDYWEEEGANAYRNGYSRDAYRDYNELNGTPHDWANQQAWLEGYDSARSLDRINTMQVKSVSPYLNVTIHHPVIPSG